MLAVVEKLMFVQKVPLFAHVQTQGLTALATATQSCTVEHGQTVCGPDLLCDTLSIIVEGQVRVMQDQHSVTTWGSKQCFGQSSLLQPAPYPARVTAQGDCLLLQLPHEAFAQACGEEPQILQAVLQALVPFVDSTQLN